MILLDYSQLMHASTYQFQKDIEDGKVELLDFYRKSILNSIKYYKKKFRQYGNVVLTCDGKEYWRKDVFPLYKANRKKTREESKLPWNEIHEAIHQLREEITGVMPFNVLYDNKAEADDIMGIMVEHVVNKTPIQMGLEEGFEPTMLVTSDKDISQLLKYAHIEQFSPNHQKLIHLEYSPKEYLRRLILTGDSGDGICNVFSPADSLVNGVRQKAAREVKMTPFLEATNMLDATDDPQIKKRIMENTRLISFNAIPQSLITRVVEQYQNQRKGTKMDAYAYFVKHKCDMLLDDIESF